MAITQITVSDRTAALLMPLKEITKVYLANGRMIGYFEPACLMPPRADQSPSPPAVEESRTSAEHKS